MPKEEMLIRLSNDEALVLFEFLSRFCENDKPDIEDQAEERVLLHILGYLESRLVEPFKPDYLDLLDKARSFVRGEEF